MRGLNLVVAVLFASSVLSSAGSDLANAQTATCQSSIGPGIPPPAQVPQGIAGFHAAWYGQSGYMRLCPGSQATATVAYNNSGSFGWLSGRMGQVAYLGTWEPTPGQDRPSPLGGDGTNGTPNTAWPRYNRIAVQPAPYVGPGQVSWFQFLVQAPTTPGSYRLYLRPLIEGAQWMEDYGVFWLITVLNPDGSVPTTPLSLVPPPPVVTPQPPAPPPVVTPPPPAPTPTPSSGFNPYLYIGQGDAYNCSNFTSQADAQAVLRADPQDPNQLDSNRDGVACESNPAPYDRTVVPR